MKPSPKSPPPEDNPELDWEQELASLERSLLELKARYAQVQRDRQQQAEWQQELHQLRQNRRQTPEIKAELQYIQQQLQQLELNLESQLLSWDSFKKPFWQIIRFGGMGVIIGWILKSCVG